jgi:hypothetical protein
MIQAAILASRFMIRPFRDHQKAWLMKGHTF